jgi:hypothetical protein
MDAKNVYYLYRNLVEETMQGHKNAKEASKKLKEFRGIVYVC